jgi:hypothetical protein
MDTLTTTTYTTSAEPTTPWWYMIACGVAGKPAPSPLRQDHLQALVAGRRAAATEKCKKIRRSSERGIARLIRETYR